jgi:delta14-sterol reductase
MLPLNLHSIAFGFVAVFGFVGALFLLSIVLPGKTLQGVQLKDGTRVSYKLNGFLMLLLVAAVLLGGQFSGLINLASLVHHFWGLVVAANVLSFGATFWLYARGVRAGDSHDDEKPSVSVNANGEAVAAKPSMMSIVKGLYYGVTLNPSLFGIDIKMFSYRPSLIGLWVMNTSFAAYQYEQ